MKQIVGTCSLCGGPVTLPDAWWGVIPPLPTCGRCNAVAASYGPIIPMRPQVPVEFDHPREWKPTTVSREWLADLERREQGWLGQDGE